MGYFLHAEASLAIHRPFCIHFARLPPYHSAHITLELPLDQWTLIGSVPYMLNVHHQI